LLQLVGDLFELYDDARTYKSYIHEMLSVSFGFLSVVFLAFFAKQYQQLGTALTKETNAWRRIIFNLSKLGG
jgi:hypothetical protein